MKHLALTLLLGCALAVAGCAGLNHSTPPESGCAMNCPQLTQDPMIARSQTAQGNPARLMAVFERARRGEPLTVGVLGGSITEGALSSAPEKCWAGVMTQWWRDTFPQSTITFVNAGIGGTGSDIGVHRAQTHLLNQQPDFAVVEFSVNDMIGFDPSPTMEGLIRKILNQPNTPALMLLFMTDDHAQNRQAQHLPLGAHYGLPMISFHDAIWDELNAGRMQWTDISPDTVHPNDKGHAIAGRMVIAMLETILAQTPAQGGQCPRVSKQLPAPLLSDVYEGARLDNAQTLTPTANTGWSVDPADRFGGAWVADQPGATLEFEVTGSVISLIYHRAITRGGVLTAQVDDLPPVQPDAYFEADWGGGFFAFQNIAKDLTPGPHRLRLTLPAQPTPGRDNQSFCINAILTTQSPHGGK